MPTDDALGPHPAARAACAADAGCDPADVRVLRVSRAYKSAVAFVRAGDGDAPTHVVKLDPAGAAAGRWDPARELAGLRHAAAHVVGDAVGTIPPVDCGTDWLVSRYVPGDSARPVFDRALSRPFAGKEREHARGLAAAAGRWLTAFRRGGEGDSEVDGDALLGFLRERAGELARHVSAEGPAARGLAAAEALLTEIPDASLARRFPTHGDFAPQNLHVGTDARLYVLDFEGFAVRPLDADLARFRMRLEHQTLRAPWARGWATDVWRSFSDARLGSEAEARPFGALCYVHWLLGHLAWLSLPAELAPQRPPERGATAVRSALWRRSRARWLADLPTDAAGAVAYCRARL